jgi:hypothetical protein
MSFTLKKNRNTRGRRSNLTDEQIVKILILKAQGLNNKQIFHKVAEEFKLTLTRSYYTKAASHYWRVKKQTQKRIKDGDKDLVRLLRANQLVIEDDG